MNTKEIITLIQKDRFAKRIFVGVFAKDQLLCRNIPSRPSAYVINTDPSNKPGEHWVAVYFDGKGNAEYFDSFGFPPSFVPSINRFIVQNSFKLKFNKRLLQELTSAVCGYYVIYFIMMKSRGATMTRLLAAFNPTQLRINDQRVFRLVKLFLSRK